MDAEDLIPGTKPFVSGEKEAIFGMRPFKELLIRCTAQARLSGPKYIMQTGGGGRGWEDIPRSPPAGGKSPLHSPISQNIEKPCPETPGACPPRGF